MTFISNEPNTEMWRYKQPHTCFLCFCAIYHMCVVWNTLDCYSLILIMTYGASICCKHFVRSHYLIDVKVVDYQNKLLVPVAVTHLFTVERNRANQQIFFFESCLLRNKRDTLVTVRPKLNRQTRCHYPCLSFNYCTLHKYFCFQPQVRQIHNLAASFKLKRLLHFKVINIRRLCANELA